MSKIHRKRHLPFPGRDLLKKCCTACPVSVPGYHSYGNALLGRFRWRNTRILQMRKNWSFDHRNTEWRNRIQRHFHPRRIQESLLIANEENSSNSEQLKNEGKNKWKKWTTEFYFSRLLWYDILPERFLGIFQHCYALFIAQRFKNPHYRIRVEERN